MHGLVDQRKFTQPKNFKRAGGVREQLLLLYLSIIKKSNVYLMQKISKLITIGLYYWFEAIYD